MISYRPTITLTNTFGFLKEPGLDLGLYKFRLEKFISYDPISELIWINGPEATREDIGTYELRFYVTFSNSTLEWDEDFFFELYVHADEIIDNSVIECQESI